MNNSTPFIFSRGFSLGVERFLGLHALVLRQFQAYWATATRSPGSNGYGFGSAAPLPWRHAFLVGPRQAHFFLAFGSNPSLQWIGFGAR